jgi:hypothetical protein
MEPLGYDALRRAALHARTAFVRTLLDGVRTLLEHPLLPAETLLDWVAGWVRDGGALLDKPTSFERRDGRF